MRRYRARLRSGSTLATMTLRWDPNDHRYVCERTSAGGDVRGESFEHLRDVIHQLRWDAVIDDTLLRALLKDRGGTHSATGSKP